MDDLVKENFELTLKEIFELGGNKKNHFVPLKNNTRKPHHSRFFYAFFIVNFHPKFSNKKKKCIIHTEKRIIKRKDEQSMCMCDEA